MRSALPLAVLLAGCDLVYGLGDRVAPDATPEADVLPEPDAPLQCTMFSATVVASADTMLVRDNAGNCDPANRQGAAINVNLGQDSAPTRSRVLIRFPLTTEIMQAVGPDGGFVGATLHLPLKPNACAVPCASSAIGFSIFAANNDWNEGTMTGHIGANWCMRKQLAPGPGTAWQMQGADGAMDRSSLSLADVAVTSTMAIQDEIAVPFGLDAGAVDDLRAWVMAQQISLLLVPTTPLGEGELYIRAHEDSAGGPRLTIRWCR